MVREVVPLGQRALPGYGEFQQDFRAQPAQREARKVDALALWLDRPLASDRQGEAVLQDAHGRPMEERGRQRLKARNNRPVAIQEYPHSVGSGLSHCPVGSAGFAQYQGRGQ